MSEARHPDDEFVILACDGIWDVMSSQECVNFVAGLLRATERPAPEQRGASGTEQEHGGGRQRAAWDLGAVCEALLDKCLDKGSRDNMSVVIVSLKPEFAPGTAARRRTPASAAAAAPPQLRELVVKDPASPSPAAPSPAVPSPVQSGAPSPKPPTPTS